MGNTTEISITHEDLEKLGTDIVNNGANLGTVVPYAKIDRNSTISANSAAHEAINSEKKYKKVFEKMANQEKTNLDNIGNDLYEMEATLVEFYNNALGNIEG